MSGAADFGTDGDGLETYSTTPLSSFSHDTLQRVFRKLSGMSQTLCEIEEWLDNKDAACALAVGGLAPERPLTLENLDAAIRWEEARSS